MTEARALCGEDAALVAKLDYLLSKRPNDRIMQKFIDYVRDSHRDEERFAVDSSVGCRLRQGRASSAERAGTGRDNVTPILSAVVVTIVVELLALVSLHADPDTHAIYYLWTAIIVFALSAWALDCNANG